MEHSAPDDSRSSRSLLAAGLLAAIYFLAGKLSLKLAFLHASASPVWPPAGIALAALLLFGFRLWPAIFIGAFLVNLTTAGNIPTSIGIATGNTLEAVMGAWLIQRFAGGVRVFERAYDVFKFALAVALSTVISPTIGLTGLAMAGFADWASYPDIWLTWWLGDLGGMVMFAPLLVLWLAHPFRRINPARDVEVAILLLLLTLLSEVVFGGWFAISTLNYPIAFVLGPIIAWTAFRLTPRETATSLKDAEADRTFFRDVLEITSVDVGHGWLIFALPPAEVAVHPAEGNDRHELYFMCDNLQAEIAALAAKGIVCSDVQEERWGLIATLPLPGGGEVGLYQPKHPTALNAGK